MEKTIKRVSIICICVILCFVQLLNPVAIAATDIYELSFDNLFVFEQWANHANSGIVTPGLTGGEITKDISAGSFTLTNNSSGEIYTSHSMGSNTGYYSMPVEPNTTYIFEYSASGTATSFETFVFFFDSLDNYFTLINKISSEKGSNIWSFTTPENAAFIQIRFDNNSPGTYVKFSNIRICKEETYEYTKNIVSRKVFTYSSNAVYGELPVPQRDGLFFAGWYTGPDGTGERITADTAVAENSYGLYSKWEPYVNEIKINSMPAKQEYCIGEKLNKKGLEIAITHLDGTIETMESGFSCYPEVLNKTGTQTITVSYGGKTAEFTVNVKESIDSQLLLNGTSITVPMANYKYTFGKTVSAFNRFEIKYSSDVYVRGELSFNGTIEEFFLEPSENGVFSSYIDGYLDGVTQTQITSITFTALNSEFMDFTLSSVETKSDPVRNNMVYLTSDDYTIGIDLKWGGALTYLEDLTNNVMSSVAKKSYYGSTITEVDFSNKVNSGSRYNTSSSVNLINCNDTGRLVQQSYYGTGSYPYEMGDYNGTPWNYNPVQGGNVKNEPSKIIDLQVTENQIYVKCQPLDWGKYSDKYADANGLSKKYGKDYITPSYMEAWYTLEDGLMKATCRFVDFSGYPESTTTQELPAFYCVEPLNNFVYYSGGEPWSDSNTKVTQSNLEFWGEHPEQFFNCNENWAAFIGDDADSFGIGLYCPGQTNMYSGVFCRDECTSTSPATEGPTSYIAAVDTFTFKSFNPFSYAYYITTGNIDTIRSNFKKVATDPADPCKVGYTNGYCNNCGKCQSPTLTTDKYDINNDGNTDSVYEISNAGELRWFSANVNAGDVSANAVVVCDITDNEDVLVNYGTLNSSTAGFRSWEPIGNSINQFNGIFDGQGNTINGIYLSNSSKDYGGLFGYIGTKGVVKKVGVDFSFFKGGNYVGSICGYNAGLIENSYAFYTVAQGNSFVGGITGYNNSTIKNCYNTGIVNANNYIGGIAGSASGSSKTSNCYYLIDAATDSSKCLQYGIGNASKGVSTADVPAATEYKTIEQFASGEVAYLLQSANPEQIWGQKTNTKGSGPVFDMSGKYKVIEIDGMEKYSLVSIGDVDEDGDVDVSDYQGIVNIVLSDDEFDFPQLLRSDLDGDGYLDAIDCALMCLLIKGYVEPLQVYLKGDFDCDGVPFTQTDIAAIKKGLLNSSSLSIREKYVCDLNFDGILDEQDSDLLNQQETIRTKPIFTNIEEAIERRGKTANVIILAGQSNAYGASPLTQEVRNVVGSTDFSNVKIKYTNINSDDGINNWKVHYANSEFETYRLGIGGQANDWFGPEAGIAYHLATTEATKDEVWYIIKTTAAGTYLGGNWLYDTTGKYYNAAYSENIKNNLGVYLADGMINLVGADLDGLAGRHGLGNINIRSFMWMQGESDSCVKEWADQYGELQNILVNRVRTELGGWDVDSNIPFVDGAIAAYNSSYNMWTYSDTVNTAKANNATHWYVPQNTTRNVINKTTAGLYANTSGSATQLENSLWIDTSTCKSKLENNNENGEGDGAHYCGESMFRIGRWFAQGMLVF